MFPVPEALLTSVSFPLKMIVANTGVAIIRLTGIPVFQEGFQITIPAGQLLVGNPCSGLRSIISFLSLASIMAYIKKLDLMRGALFTLSAIPIAMLANVMRVLILILISHVWGLEVARPDSFWHSASGIAVFIIGFCLLLLLGNLFDDQKN